MKSTLTITTPKKKPPMFPILYQYTGPMEKCIGEVMIRVNEKIGIVVHSVYYRGDSLSIDWNE